jgi:hypothetical protein
LQTSALPLGYVALELTAEAPAWQRVLRDEPAGGEAHVRALGRR